MARHLATRWQYRVGYGNAHSSLIGGALTLREALRKAITDGLYYIGIGEADVRISVEEHCNRCDGTGSVMTGTRRARRKACPDCRGEGVLAYLGEIPVVPHENVAGIIGAAAV